MLRFVNMFRWVYHHLMKSNFSRHGLLAYAKQHKKQVLNAPKMISSNFTWNSVKAFGFFLVGANLALWIMIAVGAVGFKYLSQTVSTTSFAWALEYWPISWSEVNQVLTWLISVNLFWTIFVGVNHWNDLANIFLQINDGSLPTLLGTCYAYWYTSCWVMWSEFFQTLSTDPAGLFSTKVIAEVSIGYNNCLALLGVGYEFLAAHVAASLMVYLNTVVSLVSDLWNSLTFLTIGLLKGSWLWLVSGITKTITPVVPAVVQPVVDYAIVPFAKALAVSLLLWILRVIFGFPF